MAIYSCNHSSVGKSTHAPGTAAAHIRYITRPEAKAQVLAQRMPVDRHQARAWLNEQEISSRKNERMIDKVLGALPRELSHAQQDELVRGFAEHLTQSRAPWLAAIHRTGKDATNPHMHLVIRDRDPETGKKVAQLSSKGSTEQIRQGWELHVNRALERAGREERVDRRSLKAQGIEHAPTIHVGPRVKAMEAKGYKPQRTAAIEHQPVGGALEKAKKTRRMEDYRRVTRMAYNAQIRPLRAFVRSDGVQVPKQAKGPQTSFYASEKAMYEQEWRNAQQRLQARGLRKLVRNITGRTQRDRDALEASERKLTIIRAQEAAQRAELHRQRAEAYRKSLEQKLRRTLRAAKEQQNTKQLSAREGFGRAGKTQERDQLRQRREQSRSRGHDRGGPSLER